ncbi:MAG: alpha/beta fold hydrolase [Chloroflexaceae bacterium]|nr:alpha/beta fold hydrolase [Chloroflexaceae bacterium]
MPTSTISTRHGQMAYLSIGHGRPFVLLHGNTMTAASQEKLARRFIDEYRVVCVDLLGHGRSARPLHLFSRDYFRLQGEAVADLLTGLFANEQVIVFGMSAGGVAALNAACHCQDRIAALVIDSSFSYIGVETLIAHREGMEYLSPSWEHYLRNQHGHDWWPQLKTGLLDTIGQLAETMDSVTPCLAAIRAPTLIFQGGQDPFSHESQGREMAMTIPNAKLIYDPEAGHILSWRDPGRFRNTVREFLHEQLVLWS